MGDLAAPLSARSVVLSLALGAHPEPLTAAQLVRAGEHFGIPEPTVRVAVTRATAAGDLARGAAGYGVGDRLARRQHRQAEGVEDAETDWDGEWELAVVVVSGRSAARRAALRDRLADARLAELREGVWLRPANLRRPPPYADDPVLQSFRTRPDGDPSRLAAALWDLSGWARRGRRLLDRLARTSAPAQRLAATAAVVRHLATDPMLPAELLPEGWPGNDLRAGYAVYQRELRGLW